MNIYDLKMNSDVMKLITNYLMKTSVLFETQGYA